VISKYGGEESLRVWKIEGRKVSATPHVATPIVEENAATAGRRPRAAHTGKEEEKKKLHSFWKTKKEVSPA